MLATDTADRAAPAADDGPLPSHVLLDDDRLVLAVRGPDVLVTWPVDPTTGLLGAASAVTAGGAWPRHLAIVDGLAVVANQVSGDLAVVRLPGSGPRVGSQVGPRWGADPAGTVAPTGSDAVVASLRLPAPACVVPVVR